MPSTYEPIATTTVSTATASVTFSSISGYTDLFLVCDYVLTSSSDNLMLRFNSDTGSNYSDTMISGNGSAVSSNRQTNNTYIRNGYWEAGRSRTNVSIMNYANSTTYKSTIARQFQSGTTTSYVIANVGLWRNTNAITSVTLDAVSGNIDTSSIFSIYGIKAA